MKTLPDTIEAIVAIDTRHEAVLRGLLSRQRAAWAFAAAPGRRNAFIQIEKVSRDTPVALFGQPVSSIAHSRITLYGGRREGDAWVPGEPLLAWDISERALSRVMLDATSSEMQPMTLSSIGGVTLPPYEPVRPDYGRMLAEQTGQIIDRHEADAIEARDAVASRGKPGKGFLSMLPSRITNLIRTRDVSFVLERHVENLVATKSALEYEVLTAAAQAAMPPGMLASSSPTGGMVQDMNGGEGPGGDAEGRDRSDAEGAGEFSDASRRGATGGTDRFASPVWDAACNSFTPEEEAALREGIETLLPFVLSGTGVDLTGYHIGDDPHGQTIRNRIDYQLRDSDAVQEAVSLARLWNHVGNPSVLVDRHAARPREMGCTISRLSGSFPELHSSYAGHADAIVRLSVKTAVTVESFGTEKIRPVSEFATIDLSYEDFMMALRDGVLGHKTPCTLSRIFGIPTEVEKRPESESERILETVDAGMAEAEASLRELASRLEALIGMTGLATKADRKAAVAIFDEALLLYQGYRDSTTGTIAAKAAELEALMRRDVATRLEAIPTIRSDLRRSMEHLVESGGQEGVISR